MDRIPTHDNHDYATGEKYLPPSHSPSDDAASHDNEHKDKGEYTPPEHSEQPIEPIRTISRVPGNPNYYEKNGLRTYGDGMDHEHEPPMTFTRLMALVSMAFLWCGSQIPVYLFGGVLPIIYADIGGIDIYVWSIIGNLLALAAVTPFVGALSDLFGRRMVGAFGMLLILIGMIICSAAPTMNVFIAGECIAGVGSGITEMTALAATGELAPTSKRGIYVGLMICTITPFTPAVLWSQLIAAAPHSSWRYNGLWCALWAFVGLVLLLVFYHPPPRPNSSGLTRREILKRIDFVGGVLSTVGVVLFLVGLISGGYNYPWGSYQTLVPLILGVAFFVAFVLWELYGARWPMWPGRLRQEPRTLILVLIITFASGANFFAVLVWWPTQSQSMYDPAPIQVGIRGLPIGFGIIGGAVIMSLGLAILKGNIRFLLFMGCAVMTAGAGAMTVATPYNVNVVYAPITLACVGVGMVIIPIQIIITIICPDDLIATATALGITIRMVGGAIGFAIYFNLFYNSFVEQAVSIISPSIVAAGVTNYGSVVQISLDIGHNYFEKTVYNYPQINTQEKYDVIVKAGRDAFAVAYRKLWWGALAFGAISTLASLGISDISKYLDDHIAVALH